MPKVLNYPDSVTLGGARLRPGRAALATHTVPKRKSGEQDAAHPPGRHSRSSCPLCRRSTDRWKSKPMPPVLDRSFGTRITPFCRIRFKDPESGKTLVFITNNFSLVSARGQVIRHEADANPVRACASWRFPTRQLDGTRDEPRATGSSSTRLVQHPAYPRNRRDGDVLWDGNGLVVKPDERRCVSPANNAL